jgi:hypothetical protein
MANYLARIAISGARVGFEASPSLPPTVVPKTGIAQIGTNGFDEAGDQQLTRVVENDTLETGAVADLHTPFRAEVETVPLEQTRTGREDSPISESDSHASISEQLAQPSSGHSSAPQATKYVPRLEHSPSGRSEMSAEIPIDRAAPDRGVRAAAESTKNQEVAEPKFTANHRGETTQERRPKPASSVQPRMQGQPSPMTPTVPTITAPPLPATERKSDTPQAIQDGSHGPQSSGSHAVAPAVTSSASGNAPSGLRIEPANVPQFPPRGSRTTEQETRITIGRVDVQVNGQSPIPARRWSEPRAISNRKDVLRGRFLDRFTLRP